MSGWVPGGQVVTTVLGLGYAIYEAANSETTASVQFSGHGFAQVKIWCCARRSSESNLTKISITGDDELFTSLPGYQVTTMGTSVMQEGITPVKVFDGHQLKAGDMVSTFVELNTSGQIEAKKTGEGTKWIEARADVWIPNPQNFSLRLEQ